MDTAALIQEFLNLGGLGLFAYVVWRSLERGFERVHHAIQDLRNQLDRQPNCANFLLRKEETRDTRKKHE